MATGKRFGRWATLKSVKSGFESQWGHGQFDVGWQFEELGVVRNQAVRHSAAGSPYPTRFMSYNESVTLDVAELVRLAPMDVGRLYPCGHSQVAEVVARILSMIVPLETGAYAAPAHLRPLPFLLFQGRLPAARK